MAASLKTVALTFSEAARKIDGFFYGLFMDERMLREAGVHPSNPRRAYVSDWALRIGDRACLVPSEGDRAYGMLIALTHDELEVLYGAPGLEDYRPEAVLAHCLDGEDRVPALCFNLVEAPHPEARNPEYSERLRAVLVGLDLPRDGLDA